MIVVMKPGATAAEIGAVIRKAESMGVKTHPIYGDNRTVVALVGDLTRVTREIFDQMDGVMHTLRIQEPYKLSSRTTRPENSVIEIAEGCVRIGGNPVVVMAGPCSVESREQIIEIAHAIKEAGGAILRGGAYKPRSSPYSFQGLGEEGLRYLAEAREQTGLPIITEVMTPEDIEVVGDYADILQVGARNTQNYSLLRALGKQPKPVFLKRGMSATIQELLMSAEYILSGGNMNVMVGERGIRTYETATRFTFDVNAIPVLKELSHLPVVADPAHGTGKWNLVTPIAKAAVAAGADSLMVEVHPNPAAAWSDGAQSLTLERFAQMMRELRPVAEAVGRSL